MNGRLRIATEKVQIEATSLLQSIDGKTGIEGRLRFGASVGLFASGKLSTRGMMRKIFGLTEETESKSKDTEERENNSEKNQQENSGDDRSGADVKNDPGPNPRDTTMNQAIRFLFVSNIPIIWMSLAGYRGFFLPFYICIHYTVFFYFRFKYLKSKQYSTGGASDQLKADHKTEPKWALAVLFPLVFGSQIVLGIIKDQKEYNSLFYISIVTYAIFLLGSFFEGVRRIRI